MGLKICRTISIGKLNEHETCTNRDEIFLSVGITLEQEFKAQKFNLNSHLKSLKLNSY